MSSKTQSPDFIAELKYKTTKQGGRKTPAKPGYRPQVKFGFTEMQTSGCQVFIDTEIVYPGETVLAEITVISPHFFKNRLEKGMEFDFREGAKVVGYGKVLEIKSKSLFRK